MEDVAALDLRDLPLFWVFPEAFSGAFSGTGFGRVVTGMWIEGADRRNGTIVGHGCRFKMDVETQKRQDFKL